MFLTVWKKLSEVSPPYPQKPLDSLPQEFSVTLLMVRGSMDICWFLSLEKQIHYFMPGCASFRYKGKNFSIFFCSPWFILLLQKISRKLKLSKTKNTKFNDSGILLPFYFFFAAWGTDIIVKVTFYFLFLVLTLIQGYCNDTS